MTHDDNIRLPRLGAIQRKVLAALDGEPKTVAQLASDLSCPRGSIRSALRALLLRRAVERSMAHREPGRRGRLGYAWRRAGDVDAPVAVGVDERREELG